MNIPDEAIEAAAKAEWDRTRDDGPYESVLEIDRGSWREYVRPLIEAAAPYIAAQALREAADGQDDATVAVYLLNLADGHMGCDECRADEIEE